MKQTPGRIEEGMERLPANDGPVPSLEGNSGTTAPEALLGWWRWDFLLALLVATLTAYLIPLDDSDLPMHLRTGEWILTHGRVPVVEPFAWTRAGDPFYAYSWLPEVLYSLAWRAGGAMALALLHAVTIAVVLVAFWDLARTARWSVWATRLTLSVHLVLWLVVQPATRPQLWMAALLPMAWAGAYRLAGDTSWRARLSSIGRIVVANALAVNAHLFFFLMPVPVVVLLARRPTDWKRVVWFLGATLGGWLLSPYAGDLLGILSLNFAPNALQGAASPIVEMEPGFSLLLHAPVGMRLLVAVLLLLPFLPFFAERSPRERWWYALAWLAGLGLFGIAWRGVLIWWLFSLPLLAWAFASIPLPQFTLTKRLVVATWSCSLVGTLGFAVKRWSNPPERLPLPHPAAVQLEGAVRWLGCAAPATGREIRATTAFNFGSYLTWRLPQYSWSVDGRVIFPDSIAKAEAGQALRSGVPVSPPWRSGMVVLLESSHAVWREIERDRQWQRVPLPLSGKKTEVTLFVRQDMFRRASHCPLT